MSTTVQCTPIYADDDTEPITMGEFRIALTLSCLSGFVENGWEKAMVAAAAQHLAPPEDEVLNRYTLHSRAVLQSTGI